MLAELTPAVELVIEIVFLEELIAAFLQSALTPVAGIKGDASYL